MCAGIKTPASYKKFSAIRFLLAKKCKVVEIHHQLCRVCEEKVMTEGVMRQGVVCLKKGRPMKTEVVS